MVVWRQQILSWDWKAQLTICFRRAPVTDRVKDLISGPRRYNYDSAHEQQRLSGENEALIHTRDLDNQSSESRRDSPLSLPETIIFAAKFSVLWVLANYFTAACFQSITVASGTAIVSTSSLWTLMFGRILHVEPIHWKKILGVVLSFIGILLILATDLFTDPGDNRGSFPEKSQQQIAVGSGLALVSAIMYGCYGTFAKRSIGDETRANMPLVFGLVGAFNTIGLLPVLTIWHYTELETFELPPNGRIVMALTINAIVSVLSDLAWFYAVLVTSPVVVTVVLSLTIPLSLVGQIFANDQYVTGVNLLGSLLVTIACVLVNLEWETRGAADVASENPSSRE